jgi:hypothetical protein
MIYLGAPQIIYLIIAVLGLVINIRKATDGTTMIGNTIGFGLIIGILYWGGFFS